VVQGALKLILGPIFEADFQSGSYGDRPKRSAHEAVARVAHAIAHQKTRVLDFDLRSFFDNVRHHILFEKVARRVNDPELMHLLKLLVKATGKKGLSQGVVLSPGLSNLYLNDVDRMLERLRTPLAGPTPILSTHGSPTIVRHDCAERRPRRVPEAASLHER
jgi:RNA-directed DNA polymerase